ncbi:hypothetical protein C0989_002863 [Termitomyces sp. Mn162]|nr:hypothetical protein C0989_002863 [Termitomyces sp. Mn162]
MAIPSDNLRIAYEELGCNVEVALRTQLGDAACLGEQKQLCLQFYRDLHQHAHLLQPEDYQIVQQSLDRMIASLDDATLLSADYPDAPAPLLGTSTVSNGQPGCPRIDIQPDDLARLTSGRATHKQIAALYGCSARTIRRRLIEYGLSRPSLPVYTQHIQSNGSIQRQYAPGVSADLSQLSNEEFDAFILDIYEQFPSFGRRMIDGFLLSHGERVPRQRIIDSYSRVIGPTTSTFAPRRIQRRIYSVPGPNSLWHHDGQHGLIRWKIVIHAFIDGFSRLLLGIRAHNNNRAQTVLQLFEDIAAIFGYPSRIRGDHGTENILVAARMEEVRAAGRGSYIWGRSVHNICIERLWVDVTRGVGKKWKNLFRHLEIHDGLDADNNAHIWLLHYLFLNAINTDLEVWAEVWNYHVLAHQNEHCCSPRDMFAFGMQENGLRGLHLDETTDGDLEGFGIDWNDIDNTRIRHHHDAHNANDGDAANPFLHPPSDHLSHTEVLDPQCPFTIEQLALFEPRIAELPTFNMQDMQSRRLLWIESLSIAIDILSIQ